MRTIVPLGVGRPPWLWVLAATVLWLAGCASPVYEPAAIRTRIESGTVAVGDSTAAVIASLGSPHLRLVPPNDSRRTERWLYTEETRQNVRTITVGRFETHYDPEGRIYSHFIIPEDRVQYETQVHVIALLTFEEGKLVSIKLPRT